MGHTEKPKLAAVIRQKLEQKGMNLTKAALEIDVPGPTFRAWLRENKMDSNSWSKIANLTGLPIDIEIVTQNFDVRWVHTKRGRPRLLTNVKDYDFLPIIKAIAESGVSTITFPDFQFLVSKQADLPNTMSPLLVRELLANLHE